MCVLARVSVSVRIRILFAPLGGLEIRQIGVEGSVLIPEIRLSINLNAATIDKVIARRRKLLEDMGDSMDVEARCHPSTTTSTTPAAPPPTFASQILSAQHACGCVWLLLLRARCASRCVALM